MVRRICTAHIGIEFRDERKRTGTSAASSLTERLEGLAADDRRPAALDRQIAVRPASRRARINAADCEQHRSRQRYQLS